MPGLVLCPSPPGLSSLNCQHSRPQHLPHNLGIGCSLCLELPSSRLTGPAPSLHSAGAEGLHPDHFWPQVLWVRICPALSGPAPLPDPRTLPHLRNSRTKLEPQLPNCQGPAWPLQVSSRLNRHPLLLSQEFTDLGHRVDCLDLKGVCLDRGPEPLGSGWGRASLECGPGPACGVGGLPQRGLARG